MPLSVFKIDNTYQINMVVILSTLRVSVPRVKKSRLVGEVVACQSQLDLRIELYHTMIPYSVAVVLLTDTYRCRKVGSKIDTIKILRRLLTTLITPINKIHA